jgi:threonine aldolase
VTGLCLDFRSDTRTAPDAAMRAAMAAAEVGDDAYGDDPEVLRLEAAAAELTGKQSALFVPSGTMANLLAVTTALPAPGGRVVTGERTHLARFEAAGLRRVSGATLVTVAQRDDGAPVLGEVERALTAGPGGTVLSLENTCMLHSGSALPATVVAERAEAGRRSGAHVHLDGARLANAAVALGVPVARLAAPADSVNLCLAKGLGAPVGSVLCGAADFVARARELRGELGGTMHQASVVAAAGLVALRRLPLLAEDHAVAATLAAAIAAVPRAELARPPHPTNIVTVRLPGLDANRLCTALAAYGVAALPLQDGWVRLVVHRAHSASAAPVVANALAHVSHASADEAPCASPLARATGPLR